MVGHEQAGRRPALVVSPASYNGKKGYPFEVMIPEGLDIGGVVLSDQVKSLDWRVRKAERICSLPASALTEVLQKISALLE